MLSELAEMFLEELRSAMDSLKRAVEEGDAQAVERTAHTLKGSSGNMGARKIAWLCARLQEIGASGNLASATAVLARLEEELNRIHPELVALSQSS
jgi:HPt (histidine-containing phosphotransfer) domain-containing protein